MGDKAKGFHDLYDKQMPQFLNKFGKQFGAQVRPGGVNTDDKNGHSQTEMLRASGIPEQEWGQIPYPKMESMLADYSAAQPPRTHPTHSFPITPEMREHVLKNGMPLYNKGGEVSRETGKVKGGIIKPVVTQDEMQYALTKAKR